MEAPIKRNVAKLLMWGAAAWVGYKAVSGLANKDSPEKIIKETVKPIEKAAVEVKKVTKRLLKGSPEAKAHMANLRSKNKTPRGQGKRALKKKAKKDMYGNTIPTNKKDRDAQYKQIVKQQREEEETRSKKSIELSLKKDDRGLIVEKKKAGKKGGDKTASKGKHKGHNSKKGLKQDQAKISKEVHEKHYQKVKKKT